MKDEIKLEIEMKTHLSYKLLNLIKDDIKKVTVHSTKCGENKIYNFSESDFIVNLTEFKES